MVRGFIWNVRGVGLSQSQCYTFPYWMFRNIIHKLFLFRRFNDYLWHIQCRNGNDSMIEKMHNKNTWGEKSYSTRLTFWFSRYLSEQGAVHYTINSILYINTWKVKYINLYEQLIHRLEIYTNEIRILSKGYLPILMLPSTKFLEILNEVKKTIQITNPEYDIVIRRLYYDMKLATFGIDD